MSNETKGKFEKEGASYQHERELLRVTKEELSDMTGYSYDTISKFEEEKRFSQDVTVLKKIIL